jgi:hypothetical protein
MADSTQIALWGSVPSASASIASAFTSILLVKLTARYVRLTHALVEEAKANKMPNVFVDLEFGSDGVKFVVGNSGSAPAANIAFSIIDNISWRTIGEREESIGTLQVVKDGISYLAPQRTLKYMAGRLERGRQAFRESSRLEIVLTYASEEGRTFRREFVIFLSQYSNVLFESFSDPSLEIARAIKETERNRQSHERMRVLQGQFDLSQVKKTCPICCSSINVAAKKCPTCLEFIPVEKDEDQSYTDSNL